MAVDPNSSRKVKDPGRISKFLEDRNLICRPIPGRRVISPEETIRTDTLKFLSRFRDIRALDKTQKKELEKALNKVGELFAKVDDVLNYSSGQGKRSVDDLLPDLQKAEQKVDEILGAKGEYRKRFRKINESNKRGLASQIPDIYGFNVTPDDLAKADQFLLKTASYLRSNQIPFQTVTLKDGTSALRIIPSDSSELGRAAKTLMQNMNGAELLYSPTEILNRRVWLGASADLDHNIVFLDHKSILDLKLTHALHGEIHRISVNKRLIAGLGSDYFGRFIQTNFSTPISRHFKRDDNIPDLDLSILRTTFPAFRNLSNEMYKLLKRSLGVDSREAVIKKLREMRRRGENLETWPYKPLGDLAGRIGVNSVISKNKGLALQELCEQAKKVIFGKGANKHITYTIKTIPEWLPKHKRREIIMAQVDLGNAKLEIPISFSADDLNLDLIKKLRNPDTSETVKQELLKKLKDRIHSMVRTARDFNKKNEKLRYSPPLTITKLLELLDNSTRIGVDGRSRITARQRVDDFLDDRKEISPIWTNWRKKSVEKSVKAKTDHSLEYFTRAYKFDDTKKREFRAVLTKYRQLMEEANDALIYSPEKARRSIDEIIDDLTKTEDQLDAYLGARGAYRQRLQEISVHERKAEAVWKKIRSMEAKKEGESFTSESNQAVLQMSSYLKDNDILHDIISLDDNTIAIRIIPSNKSKLGKVAKSMMENMNGAELMYCPGRLRETKSAAFVEFMKNQIFLDHETLLNLKITTNCNHEFRHLKRFHDLYKGRDNYFMGYFGRIDESKPMYRKDLDFSRYNDAMHIDEVETFSQDVRQISAQLIRKLKQVLGVKTQEDLIKRLRAGVFDDIRTTFPETYRELIHDLRGLQFKITTIQSHANRTKGMCQDIIPDLKEMHRTSKIQYHLKYVPPWLPPDKQRPIISTWFSHMNAQWQIPIVFQKNAADERLIRLFQDPATNVQAKDELFKRLRDRIERTYKVADIVYKQAKPLKLDVGSKDLEKQLIEILKKGRGLGMGFRKKVQ